MAQDKIWLQSYDEGMQDLDPAAWETSYVDAVRQTFKDYPSKAALAFMGVEITFSELDAYCNRFAQMLLANGFEKGDVVGINLPNIPEYVIAWLGTLRAGCVVSGVSPLQSAEEMAYQLNDSDARGLVTLDAIFDARLRGIVGEVPRLKLVVAASVGGFLPGIKRFLGKLLGKIPKGKVGPLPGLTVYRMEQVIRGSAFPATDPGVAVTPDDIAYVQYTGGTTGHPKGAQLSHRNAVADLLITQTWMGWEHGKGLALSGFPFFHIAGLFFNANCIFVGWTQVLVPNPRDTDHICSEIDKYKPSTLVNVPSLFQLLIANPKFAELDHSNLKECICAAAPFPEESQKDLEAVVGKGKLLEVYGMTETAPLTTMNPARGKKKLGSIGLPLINTHIKLLDTTTGEEVPVGTPGEICVKGPQVMVGYYKKPEETAKAVDKDGYMHTGDVAVMDEQGYLRLVDRTKDMIIVGGFKVFSKKVEEILTEHPAVEMIALIGVANPKRPGSELVKAFMTVTPGYPADDLNALEQEIIAFAKEKLAPYEVPKIVDIREELPLTTVGKLDKKILRTEENKA
jgi:long-chain acyl-CoA synthetase